MTYEPPKSFVVHAEDFRYRLEAADKTEAVKEANLRAAKHAHVVKKVVEVTPAMDLVRQMVNAQLNLWDLARKLECEIDACIDDLPKVLGQICETAGPVSVSDDELMKQYLEEIKEHAE